MSDKSLYINAVFTPMTGSEPEFAIARGALASILLAVLRPQEAAAAAVHTDSIDLGSPSGSRHIALAAVHNARARPGRYWSFVRIRHGAGETSVSGLSHTGAKALVDAVEAARHDWWRRTLAPRVDELRAVHKRLDELADPPRYVDRDTFRDLTAGARAAVRDLPAHWPDSITHSPEIRMLREVRAFLDASDEARSAANRAFVANELVRSRTFFDRIEARPLTDEQRRAVVVDERRNLAVAAAGSGKTSVIVAKAGWLVHRKYRQPSELLLLAFAREARNEISQRMRRRIGAGTAAGVSVQTFHSLGMAIVGEAEGKRPSLARTAENHRDMLAHVKTMLRELLAHDAFEDSLVHWFQEQFAPYESEHEFGTWGEYHNYIRRNDIQSIDGKQVRSHEECEIANFLYLHGVRYRYEAPYEHPTATPDRSQYRPDFLLTEHGIYIEHFGIDAAGNPPPFVDPDRYLRDMEWKRDLHKRHGTRLIETHSHQRESGTLLRDLERRLAERGVALRRIPSGEIFATLDRHDRIDPFVRLLTTFLHHFKASQMSFDELRARACAHKDPARARAFVEIFQPLYERYRHSLARAGEIDFHDMIERAAAHVENGRWRSPYGYVMVDEFQDISPARARLLKALLASSHRSQLFAVGDDWQAIYRFAGSDISVMREFRRHFGEHERIDLQTTFRCGDRIAQLASDFVLRNPAQIRKTVHATHTDDAPAVHIGLPARRKPQPLLKEALDRIAAHARNHDGNADVLLLGRYRHLKPPHIGGLSGQYPGLRFKYTTVHGAKGLEADYVVLLGLCTGKYGFPSEIADDPLIDLVLSAPETHPNAEERRLLYVALTRARRQAFLLAEGGPPSGFVTELVEGGFDVSFFGRLPEDDVPCPVCLEGHLQPRENPRDGSTFHGCSNWPYCNHTAPACPKCGTGLPRRTEDGFHCPDCGADIEPCPDCHGWLQARTGTYGRFLGCSSYPVCSYTRKPGQIRVSKRRKARRH